MSHRFTDTNSYLSNTCVGAEDWPAEDAGSPLVLTAVRDTRSNIGLISISSVNAFRASATLCLARLDSRSKTSLKIGEYRRGRFRLAVGTFISERGLVVDGLKWLALCQER